MSQQEKFKRGDLLNLNSVTYLIDTDGYFIRNLPTNPSMLFVYTGVTHSRWKDDINDEGDVDLIQLIHPSGGVGWWYHDSTRIRPII